MTKLEEYELNQKIEGIKRNIGNSLHHYTSMETLYKIFSNKELWLSDILSMKDESEITYLLKKIFNERKYANLNNALNKYLLNNDIFVFCLSTKYDDMSQWERYSNNATGVCITFSLEKLYKFLGYNFIFNEILYNYFDYTFIEDIYNNSLNNKYYEYEGYDSLYKIILSCASAFKNQSYQSENECRFVNHCDYKLIGNRIRKFKIININESQNNIRFEDTIEKITLGPLSKQDIKTLKQFFINLGYNSIAKKISKSNSGLK